VAIVAARIVSPKPRAFVRDEEAKRPVSTGIAWAPLITLQ
jgi:hypothetical protein